MHYLSGQIQESISRTPIEQLLLGRSHLERAPGGGWGGSAGPGCRHAPRREWPVIGGSPAICTHQLAPPLPSRPHQDPIHHVEGVPARHVAPQSPTPRQQLTKYPPSNIPPLPSFSQVFSATSSSTSSPEILLQAFSQDLYDFSLNFQFRFRSVERSFKLHQ